MDGYLEGSFELAEFQEKKNKLMAEKKTKEEKLSDKAKFLAWLASIIQFRTSSSQ